MWSLPNYCVAGTTGMVLNIWRLHRKSSFFLSCKDGRNIGLVLCDYFCGLPYVVTALQSLTIVCLFLKTWAEANIFCRNWGKTSFWFPVCLRMIVETSYHLHNLCPHLIRQLWKEGWTQTKEAQLVTSLRFSNWKCTFFFVIFGSIYSTEPAWARSKPTKWLLRAIEHSHIMLKK